MSGYFDAVKARLNSLGIRVDNDAAILINNQSIMRDILLKYKDTGKFAYFDIQVTNEDPSSSVGRQTVILKDCLVEGGVLAKFESGADYLEEEMSGTFDDFEIPEKFKTLAGM